MDSFTTMELFQTQPLVADVPVSAAVQSEEETIRELVDEDTKVGFGGYCVVA
ncbi:pheromone-like protein [Mycena metata]|uniref:Pheromone-like protein n=1 Tax=Mycena metata TaxID=1033252 RepID=A0AAD7GUX8_9AGAR|nr:pheromone-like protein [Mycena metata]